MTQNWNPERYAKNARFVSELGMPVVELLNPKPGERILDLGCGDGALTKKLVEMGCQVIGIGFSNELIAAAKARGLDARVMDGQNLNFQNEFDAVFSNAALHWMKRANDVIAGVWRALKPSGRVVAESGGHGNVEKIVSALYKALSRRGVDGRHVNPWYFPTPGDYRQRLEAQGFKVTYITHFPRPTPLPEGIWGWLETFAESFTSVFPQQERTAFIEEVQSMLRQTLCDPEGNWIADYVRLRFVAIKPRNDQGSS